MKKRQAKKIAKRWVALHKAGKPIPWPAHTLQACSDWFWRHRQRSVWYVKGLDGELLRFAIRIAGDAQTVARWRTEAQR